MVLLEVAGLSLQFDSTQILDDLSIQFWEGYVHAVVGPNGAGKSTLASAHHGVAGVSPGDGRHPVRG